MKSGRPKSMKRRGRGMRLAIVPDGAAASRAGAQPVEQVKLAGAGSGLLTALLARVSTPKK